MAGSTGSGKTVATSHLVRQLAEQGLPFLVVEPTKTEYRDLLAGTVPGLVRWRLEGDARGRPAADYLRFDPMRLQRGVTVARHVALLGSCFHAAFPMEEAHGLFLANGLLEYYTAPVERGGCGLSLFRRGGVGCHRVDATTGDVYPSFATFTRFFLDGFLERELGGGRDLRGDAAELLFAWRQFFRRRFRHLVHSPLGTAFAVADAGARRDIRYANQFPALLRGPTILELDGVADPEHKALLMAFLLVFLGEHRQVEDVCRRAAGDPPPGFRHLLVVEEAHRLLAHEAAGVANSSVAMTPRRRAVSMFVDLLAEVRAYGQGVAIVDQIPTKLVPDAIKNTDLKIMLRLAARDDRDAMGDAMGCDDAQRTFAGSLRVGEAVVRDSSSDRPVLLRVPYPDTRQPALARRMVAT